jgi:multiple antibiotic resistance protein
LIGIVFLFLGKWIFKILGVQVADFKIAGGAVLLAISLRDILLFERSRKLPSETMGAMPIGTPLVVGPAVLTTIIILLDTYGPFMTVLSFVINLLITWVIFYYASAISNVLGKAGSKAVSKIAALLLAAIAVMMMRKGIIDTITLFKP